MRGVALPDYAFGAVGTAPALGRNTQFKLDFIKPHALLGTVGNFAIRDTAADANDHDEVVPVTM